jgi:hypothetical protein
MDLLFPKLDISTIFDKYDQDVIVPKLRELKYFCLLRGRLNSYVQDGDTLVAHFSYSDKQDLLNKLNSIFIVPRVLNDNEARFDKPMSADIANKLPTPIVQFPDITQPYSQNINGIDTFINVTEKYFSISVFDKSKTNWYLINEKDISLAYDFERLIESSGLNNSLTTEGQTQYGRYINRYHYPELFNI